ncbi:hypothetical protein HG536_0A02530 [Torulaspora globosa]|uniref:tRNA/rRNA methyltransferase SpoU type domain-containing protein n=1 Tax=Torulaspora globosa TaxID=48254 RepID=A0A7G3ZAA0_9SACH|nr:uncharacterized protein HG536_0A02530 [Torulaspora globosa]QLL30436.1 hypothetical protein HG536_0A02530 [Torulaspora globosa]
MSCGGLVSKYLPVEAQISLLSELVLKRSFDEVVGLVEATQLSSDNLEEIEKQILEVLKDDLATLSVEGRDASTPDRELRFLAQLIGKMSSLRKLFESWIGSVMIAYAYEYRARLFPDEAHQELLFGFLGAKQSDDLEASAPQSSFDIILLLEFLESACLFSDSTVGVCDFELDAILIGLMGCNDEVVSSKSSNLMRWRINVIAEKCSADTKFDHFCWSLVQQMLASDSTCSWKQANGHAFLLRFLTVSGFTAGLEAFVQTDEYWTAVQAALNESIQESRKIGLSILRLTIKKIPDTMRPFSTHLFRWNSLNSGLVKSWQAFTTLYEIVSLDTALNQIEAASEDILNLFKDPNIHSTWGLLLFSTGLRASMESVRKYMVALLLRIEVKSVFAKDLRNLRNIFLPSTMEAHFFNTDGKSCRYGERLTQFISEVLHESGEDASLVIETILRTLVDQGGSFDPARIYMSLGILDYLEQGKQKPLTSAHLDLITKLCEFENEDAVFETTIQTIFLKYLLHISPSVSPVEWTKCVVSHIKRKQGNYEYISPLLGSFKAFTSSQFTLNVARKELEPLIGEDPTTDLLALVLFDFKEVPVTQELLIEIAISQENVPELSGNAQSCLLSLAAARDVDSHLYRSSELLLEYPGLDFSTLKIVKLSPLFDSLIMNFTGDKFKFFVAIYKKFANNCSDSFTLSWPLLVNLYQTIKANNSDPKTTSFKMKDEIYGTFFELLYFFLVSSPTKVAVKPTELIDLLHENINKDNGNFEGNKAVAKLCAHILGNCKPQHEDEEDWSNVLRIFEMLTTIWDNFSCERLVLKQKSLHLATINGLFHPTILLYASSRSENGRNLSKRVHLYGKRIIEQAYNRRSILPLISENILSFVEKHGDKLGNADQDYGWLIDSMTGIFTCEQTSVNIFRLKTVIADLFECKLSKNNGLYERIYGVEEVAAKIRIIASLLKAPQQFKDCFISYTFHSTNLLSAKKRTDGAEEIQRLLKWQLILLCLKDSNRRDLISSIPELILNNILDEISPIIRIYMEWTIALLLSDANQNIEEFTSKLFPLMDDHSRPIVVVSAQRILFLILKALAFNKSQTFENLLSKFTSVLIPNATSSKPLVRHFSNSLMLLFWPSFQEFVKDPTFRLTIKGLYDKAVATKMSGKYRAGDANVWDINADLTLTGIFGGVLKKTIDHQLPYISKGTFIKFLPSQVSLAVGLDDTSLWLSKRSTKESETEVQQSLSNGLSQLQTKSGAWEALMTIETDGQNKAVKRSDLIVISSLVDKPPNLGGICRLCDVLGVGLLTVHDIRVKNHPQFKNVAVTADKWMPMAEVPVQEISNFMREKKREGYVLIGLEQTDKSVKLDTRYKFPRKSLILLGTEAHGIPGELLNQLDLCVEIQQFGVIRSMNIQTATAVIVHSYTIQHM